MELRKWREGKPALSVRGKYIDQRIAEFMDEEQRAGPRHGDRAGAVYSTFRRLRPGELRDDELASTRTMWNIGPMTQGFTAVAVFQL